MTCPYCGAPAECVFGTVLYPRRPDLAERLFWRCRPCDASVGCHEGTKNPLGRLANAELRRAKIAAHDAFDATWRGHRKRGEAYRWLAEQLGIAPAECHIGMFDVAQCQRVVEVCLSHKLGGSICATA